MAFKFEQKIVAYILESAESSFSDQDTLIECEVYFST